MENKLSVKQWPEEPPGSTRCLRQLAEAATEYFDTPLEELKSQTRRPEVVWPRSVCMRLASYENFTSVAIGKWWGRHHSNVLYAIKLVDTLRHRPGYEKQFRRFAHFYKSYTKRVEKK
jgi:chromosomal replication initiation ATPase DnaA